MDRMKRVSKKTNVSYCGTSPLTGLLKYHITIPLALFFLRCSLYMMAAVSASPLWISFSEGWQPGNPRKGQEVTDRETLVPWVEPEKFARVA